jgi:hypothetical protein
MGEDGRERPDVVEDGRERSVIGEDRRERPDPHIGEDGRGRPDALHDVTVQTRRTLECARVEAILPCSPSWRAR